METNYDKRIQADVDDLLSRIGAKESLSDVERIRDAFEFAREAHKPQRRKSGT